MAWGRELGASRSMERRAFHDHDDDKVNPMTSTSACAHFQQDHEAPRAGDIDQQTATLAGAYITAGG